MIREDSVRCTAPGRFRLYGRRVCGEMPSHSKITAMMVGRRPAEGYSRQPMWLCRKHWPKYPEVSAMTGERMPARPFPGKKAA